MTTAPVPANNTTTTATDSTGSTSPVDSKPMSATTSSTHQGPVMHGQHQQQHSGRPQLLQQNQQPFKIHHRVLAPASRINEDQKASHNDHHHRGPSTLPSPTHVASHQDHNASLPPRKRKGSAELTNNSSDHHHHHQKAKLEHQHHSESSMDSTTPLSPSSPYRSSHPQVATLYQQPSSSRSSPSTESVISSLPQPPPLQ
ncbi:hypothetical protein BC829DRAFT_170965 [Chytridium lagenaria]|nr:hypothetical protein BC829DRAFT_170965 [Chytridium lagenaria]